MLALLGDPPATVLELGFAGIHAMPLRLAGFDVTVVEPDPAHRGRARERAGDVLAEPPRRASTRSSRRPAPTSTESTPRSSSSWMPTARLQ